MLTRRITGSIIIFLYLLAACATESDIDSTIATSVAATLEAAGSTAVTSSSSNPTATLEESTSVTQSTNILEPTIAVEPTVTAELPPTPRLVWLSTAVRVVVLVDVEKGIIQSNEAIQAIDINNGEVLWSVAGSAPLLGADSDLVYTLPFSQRVDALDTDTGEPVWSSQLPSQPPSRFVYYSGHWISIIPSYTFEPFIIIDKTNGQGFSMQGQNLQFAEDSLLLDGSNKAYRLPSMDVVWEVNGIERCDNLVLYRKDPGEQLVAALDIQSGEDLWQAQYPGGVSKASCPVDTNFSIYDFTTQFSILTTPILNRPHPEQGSQNIYIEVSDFSNSQVLAVDRQTGTPQFINENTLLYTTGNTSSSQGSYFRWAGGFRGLDLYSQPDFGMTRAHRTDNNELIWTSNQYALNTVLGGWDDVLVGSVGTIRESIFAGIDTATGELKWQRQVEAFTPYGFVGDYFVFNDEDNILILDPRTGQVETSIPLPFEPIPIPYGENYFIIWEADSGVGLVELP